MNIYLDIDGVIITNNFQPAEHLGEFLKYILEKHKVYWLTTHCKGDSSGGNYVSKAISSRRTY